MSPQRLTTTALLLNLLDPSDEQAWHELDARFRPILFAFTRRMGLSEADAEDVTQESLVRFVKAYRKGQYDRTRGRLSSWLISIAQNCVFDLRQSSQRRIDWRGDSLIGELEKSNSVEAIWEEECRRVLLEKAMLELRTTSKMEEKTMAAFEMLAMGQQTPAQVAEKVGVSIDSVYAAKNRCLTLLRRIVDRLNAEYELA
jgi:RNA polymerase sigma-70 factor (ECF subfamily)